MPLMSRIFYPLMRSGRQLVLFMLGIPRIPTIDKQPWAWYRSWKILLAIFLVSYPLISQLKNHEYFSGNFTTGNTEFFPFFTWELFSHAHKYAKYWTIEVVSSTPQSPVSQLVGQTPLNYKLPFLEDIRFHKTARDYHRYFRRSDTSGMEDRQRAIETFFADLKITEYKLQMYTFDPIENSPKKLEWSSDVFVVHTD